MALSDFVIAEDSEKLALLAADLFQKTAIAILNKQLYLTVVLTGGDSPRRMYEILATEPFKSHIPWRRIHFFWSDERCVPSDSPESNFNMAWEAFLSKLPIPPENIHRIKTELQDPKEIARNYEAELRRYFHLDPHSPEVPVFDLVFMGLGEDGHTASLFEDAEVSILPHQLAIAPWIPHLNAFRISLTSEVFNHANKVIFIVTGRKKAEILRKLDEASPSEIKYPVQRIHPSQGELIWLVDREAAGYFRKAGRKAG